MRLAIPGCDNLRLDLRLVYCINMPHGACHPLHGTRLDVYARSIQKPTLLSYFARINKMVSCMMMDSSSESAGDLCLLTAITLSLDFVQWRQTKEEDIQIEESAILVDRSVSWPPPPLRWLARRAFQPQKIRHVLNCVTCFFAAIFDHTTKSPHQKHHMA